jgi:hypothetical protein
MSGVISEVKGWAEAPFAGSVNLLDLFLLTGAVLVFIAAWGLILFHIRVAAQEIV